MAAATPVPDLADRAAACADRLREADRVLVASHIDADGLTSAAVASTALARAGVDHEVVFEKQLDAASIDAIAAREFDVVLFTDFGSGQLDDIAAHEAAGDFVPVIADHHQPADSETRYHLNPLLEGIDGASELSGAGASYLLSRELEGPDGDNRDLAALAVVGAVGDMQESADGLVGANEAVVADGVAAGAVEARTDLNLYGRQTRPLPKLLEYASDVTIPGISNDESGAISFLSDLDVDVRRDGEWRRWVDLDADERRRLASALMQRAVAAGVPADRIESLVGTAYTLVDEEPGTELRDVSEFSTLLNATARYDRADVGLAVCLGDRGDALAEARRLLRNHRRNLSEGLQWVKSRGRHRRGQPPVVRRRLPDPRDDRRHRRRDGGRLTRGRRLEAVIAFAEESATELKVSSRGSHVLVRQGLDLSTVMREASRTVGGDGGGHDVAAGATIPADERDAFLAAADELVGKQLR